MHHSIILSSLYSYDIMSQVPLGTSRAPRQPLTSEEKANEY